uniref:Uncharacterized protein n=1 Tax=Caenorhabditis japonica TaxID=281687 RepID=A0A8R1ISZ1_CAEJA
MEYFNAGGGVAGAPGATAGNNGSIDPYSVIPQQFGNPPPTQAYPEYTDAPDYETFQQQQAQFRAAQVVVQQQQHQQAQQQPSPSMYYQPAAPGSYFPIHSASEHDFLGPQHPPTGGAAQSVQATGAASYQHQQQQQAGQANKDFLMQHQAYWSIL